MVGGIVEEVLHVEGRKVMAVLVCGTGSESSQRLGINIRGHHAIKAGDGIWWQGGNAYWTPADKSRNDVPLTRLGYSYAESVFRDMQKEQG